MTYCGERSLVKYDGPNRTVATLRCRSWTCPDCFEPRKKRLMAECHAGAPGTFMTLTSRRREGLTANEAALKLTHAWRLIRLRLMRRSGMKKLPFIAVMEATKAGWPHLHILLRSIWLDHDLISSWMAELTDSPVVDIQRIDNKARVNAYVSKYCGKAAHKFGTAKRYFKTQDYDLRSEEERSKFLKKQPGWETNPWHINRLAQAFLETGYVLDWSSSSRFVATLGP